MNEGQSDLTGQIGPWLRRSAKLAEAAGVPEIAAELAGVADRWRRPGFRLAFVGEFSRGKSTLINRLLGRSVLPTGALPTTATLTTVVAGAHEGLEITFPDGRQESRPLNGDAWAGLHTPIPDGRDQDVVAQICVSVDDAWLDRCDAELVEAPGAGDISGKRAALVLDLLSRCDAAVMVVSATIPFGSTEAAFLEREVIGRCVPRIVVVVSKLDTLPPAERAEVFATLQARVAKVSPAIPVLPAHNLDGTGDGAVALVAVRAALDELIAPEGRLIGRSRQAAGQLAGWLEHLAGVAAGGAAAAALTAEQRATSLRHAQEALQSAELDWKQYELELDRRRMEHDRTLRDRIRPLQEKMVESLAMQARAARDLRAWWERDLPVGCHHELAALSRQIQDLVLADVSEDFAWLQTSLARGFDTKLRWAVPAGLGSSAPKPELTEPALVDVERTRFWVRFGSSLASAVAVLVGGPITLAPVIGSAGVSLLSDRYLNRKTEQQQRLVAEELEKAVNRVVDAYCGTIAERRRDLYRDLIREIRREQEAWLAARRATLQPADDRSGEKRWQQLAADAKGLQQEIQAALQASLRPVTTGEGA